MALIVGQDGGREADLDQDQEIGTEIATTIVVAHPGTDLVLDREIVTGIESGTGRESEIATEIKISRMSKNTFDGYR
jgi:hypothetical protein